MVDIFSSLLLLPVSIVMIWYVKKPGSFLTNIFRVLGGGYSWVGYAAGGYQPDLPQLKKSVLPPYNILPSFEPSDEVKRQLNITYAQKYTASIDVSLMLKNYKYLGGM